MSLLSVAYWTSVYLAALSVALLSLMARGIYTLSLPIMAAFLVLDSALCARSGRRLLLLLVLCI